MGWIEQLYPGTALFMPAIKNTKSVQEFLPASFKLQQEKEAQAAENRKSFSDGPGLYLRAPKEGKNPKTGKPEAGSVEFRVMSECVFGFFSLVRH